MAQELEARRKRGEKIDTQLVEAFAALAHEYDADTQFGEAIRAIRTGRAGKFFFDAKAKSKASTNATLDKYAEMVQWYALNRNSLRASTGKQDFVTLLRNYDFHGMLLNATIANIPELANTANSQSDQVAVGFFNAASDADGVLRRGSWYFRSGGPNNPNDFDLYGSLEVETIAVVSGPANRNRSEWIIFLTESSASSSATNSRCNPTG